MEIASDLKFIFSNLIVIAQVLGGIIIIAFIFKNSWGGKIISFTSNNALLGVFIVSIIATIGSLMYSEIAGFEPCKLCWFQRIFMYPQVLILGLAIWKRDSGAILYGLFLSIVGALIALYHYLLQLGVFESAPCSATGVSCDKVYSFYYGYITIPMMALSAFALIIIFSLVRLTQSRS